MKCCPNPSCDPSFFYGSNKMVCPFCHTALTERIAGNSNRNQPIITPDNIFMADNNDQDHQDEVRMDFSTPIRGGFQYHGRITEIEHHEVFNSKWHKLFNSLFRGEPYQFAHQTSEYTLRLEGISDGYPNEVTDVCMYGNYLGRIHVGDEVTANVKDYHNRRVIKSLYNHTTESSVRPGLQIPAGIVRGIVIGLIAAVILFLVAIVVLFKTGIIGEWIGSLIASLLPVLIVGIIVFAIVFGRLPWEKR